MNSIENCQLEANKSEKVNKPGGTAETVEQSSKSVWHISHQLYRKLHPCPLEYHQKEKMDDMIISSLRIEYLLSDQSLSRIGVGVRVDIFRSGSESE